ncbi:hypothetical protein ACFQE5_22365 [Pseudonocardia hispaniensis]|uniref:Uncharacterized protein n=1 Tax=Pseudonocardia hispaniensis TaxID=904933 RepID=A0ABW1J7Y5_9PSEU
MAYTNTALTTAVTAVKNAATYISLHTADPGTTGASEVTGGTYARKATTWGSVTNGSVTGSEVTLDIPSGTTITHWGLWTLASGGTFYYGGALAASESYGSNGTYAATPTLNAIN